MSFFCHTNNPNLKMFTIWNKTFTFGSWINYLMELLRQKRPQRERSGWDVDHRGVGEEKLSEGSDRHSLFCSAVSLFFVLSFTSLPCLSVCLLTEVVECYLSKFRSGYRSCQSWKLPKKHLQILFPLKLPLSVSAAVFSGDRQIWGSISDANVKGKVAPAAQFKAGLTIDWRAVCTLSNNRKELKLCYWSSLIGCERRPKDEAVCMLEEDV